jgi:hypothetical protein
LGEEKEFILSTICMLTTQSGPTWNSAVVPSMSSGMSPDAWGWGWGGGHSTAQREG